MQKKNSRVISRLTKIKLVILIEGRELLSARLVPGLTGLRWQAKVLIFLETQSLHRGGLEILCCPFATPMDQV